MGPLIKSAKFANIFILLSLRTLTKVFNLNLNDKSFSANY